MDLVSELKRVTEHLASIEERLARLEQTQMATRVSGPASTAATPRVSMSGSAPLKYTAQPMIYERRATAAPRSRK